jgi:hypothetical protein
VEALDHLGGGPAGRDAGPHDRAHAGAADQVDRHAGLAQRAHDADVREAARTTAGQHQADGLAGQQARQPLDVVGAAHVVVGGARELRAPARRGAGRDALVVQQHELDAGDAGARAEIAAADRPRPGRRLGARHGEHRVGLPHAQLAPGRGLRIGDVDDVVVGALDAVEPGAGVVRAAHAPDELGAAVPAERGDELGGEAADVHLDALRQHRIGARAGVHDAAVARLEAPDQQLRDPQHRRRVLQDHPVERLARQSRQVAVPERAHGRAADVARDQAHLADRLAGRDPAEQARRVSAGVGAEAAGDQDVHRVRGLAGLEQRRPAGQRQPLELGRDRRQRAALEAAEDRRRLEQRERVAAQHERFAGVAVHSHLAPGALH